LYRPISPTQNVRLSGQPPLSGPASGVAEAGQDIAMGSPDTPLLAAAAPASKPHSRRGSRRPVGAGESGGAMEAKRGVNEELERRPSNESAAGGDKVRRVRADGEDGGEVDADGEAEAEVDPVAELEEAVDAAEANTDWMSMKEEDS
jgi:hypothetical protein